VSAVFYRIAGRTVGTARAGPEKSLVVASQALPLGSVLSQQNLKLRNVPENLFPSGGFSRIEDVLERPVISPIQAEEPVVEARIAARGSGQGLAPLIPAGMRAISVRVNDVVGVAGFILPGRRVDVLVTGKPPNHAESLTRTVLQNVLVLSAGQTLQTDGKNPINTPVVTLLVTPEDAEALTLANNEGHIQLVLRNSGDQQVTGTRGSQPRDLYGAGPVAEVAAQTPRVRKTAAPASPRPSTEPAPSPAPPPVRPPDPPKPAVEQVMLIRGNVKTTEPAVPTGGEVK